MRLRLNMPDTLVLRRGEPVAWFATNKVRCGNCCMCARPTPFTLAPAGLPWQHHQTPATLSTPLVLSVAGTALQEGYVVQRPAARTKMEDVRTHLLSCALDDRGRYPQYVAVARSADGMPKLLTRANLDALCERMSAAAEAGDEAEGAPCVLQVWQEGHEGGGASWQLVWWAPAGCLHLVHQ